MKPIVKIIKFNQPLKHINVVINNTSITPKANKETVVNLLSKYKVSSSKYPTIK